MAPAQIKFSPCSPLSGQTMAVKRSPVHLP
jgi:hypothetical protein